MPIITELFAYTMLDDEGDEGILGAEINPGMMMPFVGADLERMASLMPYAIDIAKIKGKPYRLKKFKLVEAYDENEDIIYHDAERGKTGNNK